MYTHTKDTLHTAIKGTQKPRRKKIRSLSVYGGGEKCNF